MLLPEQTPKYKRPWPLVVTDKRYLYPLALLILIAGVVAAFRWDDASFVSRTGNLIIGVGVWMSMRFTLRDGIVRDKNVPRAPHSEGRLKPIDTNHINKAILSIGDAELQVHGFMLVVVGSLVGSFGDIAFCNFVDFLR